MSHNNFAYFYPELAKEWDYERNIYNPEEYAPHSTEGIWWTCKNNWCGYHHWFVSINSRIRVDGIRECPFCVNKKLCEHNNFQYKHPELAKEWNYARNEHLPTEYSAGSDERVWWTCSLKHEWYTRIASRNGFCSHCIRIKGYSKGQIQWLDLTMKEQNIVIQYALCPEDEFKIPGVGKFDGYCRGINTVYEYPMI